MMKPYMVHRTGTEHLTIIDAHPYHKPLGKVDHKGAGHYTIAYDLHCPLCRQKDANQKNAHGYDRA
jgi:hypothetical protein